MILELIAKNQELIDNFNSSFKLILSQHAINSALDNLGVNNEIQQYLQSTINQEYEIGELLLRLYGLLQSLFVSIDSLYALSYHITHSKNIININQNVILRQLRYIRNDVVGHPTNREYNNNQFGYCFINRQKLTTKSFNYQILFEDGVKEYDIQIQELLNNYYTESNKILNGLSMFTQTKEKNDYAIIARKIYLAFYKNDNYLQFVKELDKKYRHEYYGRLEKVEHRILWRIHLIKSLNKEIKKYSKSTEDFKYLNYVLAYEISKLCEIATDTAQDYAINLDNPSYLKAIYRFLNKNPFLIDAINILLDFTHPLFDKTYHSFYNVALETSNSQVLAFLKLLKKYMVEENSDMVYCLCAPIKQYHQNKR